MMTLQFDHPSSSDEFDLDLRVGELTTGRAAVTVAPARMEITEAVDDITVCLSAHPCHDTDQDTCGGFSCPATACGPTCDDDTCPNTCNTCGETQCGDTCGCDPGGTDNTCGTCDNTCGNTCQTCDEQTCVGPTCEGTCVGPTCEGTCAGNTCEGTCQGNTCEGTCEGNTCEGTCDLDRCGILEG